MAGPAPQMQSEPQTMVYTVDIGNGQVADIEGPPNATPEQLQQAYAGHVEAPANDANPAALDTSGTQYQAGFSDELGAQAKSKLAPEDEAHLVRLLRGGHDDLAAQFAASKGFDISNAAAVKQARDQTGAVNPDTAYTLPEMKDLPRDLTQGAGMAAARGIADVVPGVGNLTALARTVDASLGLGGASSSRSFGDEFAFQQDLGAGAEQGDEADHPWARLAGQLFGGLAIPSGLEGVGLQAGSDVLRAGGTMKDARAAAFVAVRNRAAKTGGAYGALHGGLGADSPEDALTGAATESTLGAVAGGVLPYVAPAAAKVGGAITKPLRSAVDLATGDLSRRTLSPVASAFKEEGVPALAADVGGTFSRMATGAANMTLGGIPLAQAAEKSVAAARALRTGIADRIGTPSRDIAGRSDNLGAGLAAQRGVKASLGADSIKQGVGEKLYEAIPIQADHPASISNSKMALADLNKGLESNPELSKLTQDNRLIGYENALKGKTEKVPTGLLDADGNAMTRDVQKGGQLGWQDLKSFRSYIGELKGRATLQDSTSQQALGRLYGALSDDMKATAQSVSPDALGKFTRANNYWRGLEARREQVLTPLLGKNMDLQGEAAFNRIQQWATADKGDVFALGRALRSMPDEEANSVRATIFDRLGNVTKGRNDESGMVFSPNDFVTHWNGLSGRAKAVLFPSSDYRDSIDRLVTIASSQKGAQQFSNVSKTGNAVNGIALLTGFFSNPLGTLPVALGQLGFGKVMASKRFAMWAASSLNKPNPSAALAHINRLSGIARAEPQIANEVLQLQQRLAEAFTPTRLAADQSTGVGTPGQPQEQQRETQGAQP